MNPKKNNKKFNPVVIKNIGNPMHLMYFAGAAFLFFDLQYFLMASLPGTRDNMCVDGANLTPLNIIFSVLLSLLVGLMVSNLIALFLQKAAARKVALSSMTGAGMGLGALTLFCPICALPVVSVFGVSLGLDFVNDFNLWLKLASIVMIVFSLIMVNRRLNNECATCVYEPIVQENL